MYTNMDSRESVSLKRQLQKAVGNNDIAATKRILQECVALGYSTQRECCETALKNRCLPMVKLLLPQDVVSYYSSERLMRAAVESDFMEGVQFLHSKGGRLYEYGINECVKHNKHQVLKYVLEHKDLDRNTNTNKTLIMIACLEPNTTSLKILLNSEEINTINQQSKYTEACALHYCICGSTRPRGDVQRNPGNVLDCVKLLVEAGADINLKGKYGETPIYMAAQHGMVTTVTYLAQKGANLDIIRKDDTLLHCLARSKGVSDSYDECLQLLIKQGLDMNKLNSQNETLLHQAVHYNNVAMVKSLLNIKSTRGRGDVNISDKDGVTPLMACLGHDNLMLAKLLIDHGANVNARDNKGSCVLEYCCLPYRKPPSTDMVKMLIETGADIHIYRDLICNIINRGAYEMASILIQHGIDVNTEDRDGNKPLGLAAPRTEANIELVTLLISKDCDINHQNRQGETALHTTVKTCKSYGNKEKLEKIIDILLQNGINVNLREAHGETALMIAVMIGNKNIVTTLLEAGADANDRDSSGQTLLMMTITKSSGYDSQKQIIQSMAEVLMKFGADINLGDNNERTALMAAARECNITKLQGSLEAGADTNLCDYNGQTALMIATEECNRSGLQCLLDAGANVNLSDNSGRTALMTAAGNCDTYILGLLIKAGAEVNKTDRNGRSAIHHVMIGADSPDAKERSHKKLTFGACRNNWAYCLKLLLIRKCHVSLDTPVNRTSLFEWLLPKHKADLTWYLVAENCSLKGLNRPAATNNFQFPDTLQLSKILFESGASKREINRYWRSILNPAPERSVNKKQLDDFRGFCKSRSLQSRCRRKIRNCIGSGIRNKVTQLGLPQCLQDYIIMTDLIPKNYFTLVMTYEDLYPHDGDEGSYYSYLSPNAQLFDHEKSYAFPRGYRYEF